MSSVCLSGRGLGFVTGSGQAVLALPFHLETVWLLGTSPPWPFHFTHLGIFPRDLMGEVPCPQEAQRYLTWGSSLPRRQESCIHMAARGSRGARLGQCWMKTFTVGSFLPPLSSCLTLCQGLLGNWQHKEANGGAGFLYKWRLGLQR